MFVELNHVVFISFAGCLYIQFAFTGAPHLTFTPLNRLQTEMSDIKARHHEQFHGCVDFGHHAGQSFMFESAPQAPLLVRRVNVALSSSEVVASGTGTHLVLLVRVPCVYDISIEEKSSVVQLEHRYH